MTKQWRNILIAIVALVILFIINQRGQKDLTISLEDVFYVDKDNIFAFTITKGNEKIELTREDSLWTIMGHDSLVVKKRIMDNFLEQSLQVKRETLVSENPEKWSTYSVDDSTGTLLTLFDENGNEKGKAVFGMSKSEWSKNFIRRGSENGVYQTNKSIIHQLQTRPDYWGEKPKPPESAEIDTINVN